MAIGNVVADESLDNETSSVGSGREEEEQGTTFERLVSVLEELEDDAVSNSLIAVRAPAYL
jgi:hypothetical protein